MTEAAPGPWSCLPACAGRTSGDSCSCCSAGPRSSSARGWEKAGRRPPCPRPSGLGRPHGRVTRLRRDAPHPSPPASPLRPPGAGRQSGTGGTGPRKGEEESRPRAGSERAAPRGAGPLLLRAGDRQAGFPRRRSHLRGRASSHPARRLALLIELGQGDVVDLSPHIGGVKSTTSRRCAAGSIFARIRHPTGEAVPFSSMSASCASIQSSGFRAEMISWRRCMRWVRSPEDVVSAV